VIEAPDHETLHASCVAIDGRAILIHGPSGSGKSDLTLRLLDRGAQLVSDDYTVVRRAGDGLIASAPPTIAGIMEVRGIGIVPWPQVSDAPVALCIALDRDVERMPADPLPRRVILGIELAEIALDAFHASSAIKVELAMRHLNDVLHTNIQSL
jgi:serine kinase of HPr protein (carbohydrate metabolism regulator)